MDDDYLLLDDLSVAVDVVPLDHAGLEHVKDTLLVDDVGLASEQRPAHRKNLAYKGKIYN